MNVCESFPAPQLERSTVKMLRSIAERRDEPGAPAREAA